jgi:hypothetical protein
MDEPKNAAAIRAAIKEFDDAIAKYSEAIHDAKLRRSRSGSAQSFPSAQQWLVKKGYRCRLLQEGRRGSFLSGS